MVKLLGWCLELEIDSCGAMLLVYCDGMGMPYLKSSTFFLVGFLSGAILVHKVFGAHPLSLVTIISLRGVGGDARKFLLKVFLF